MGTLLDTFGWCIITVITFFVMLIGGCVMAGIVVGMWLAIKFAGGVMFALRLGADGKCESGSGLPIVPTILLADGPGGDVMQAVQDPAL